MKTITTIEYKGTIANKDYKASRCCDYTDKFIIDFNQLLEDLKWFNFNGFIIHPKSNCIEIFSNPKTEPNLQIINEQIIKDNPNFNYLDSGDTAENFPEYKMRQKHLPVIITK
jgi:hypothetical protein